jgi:selenide,water dikinase
MPLNIAEGLLNGIKNFMENKINSKVLGGHTIYSEWPLIGGEASGFVDKNKIINKNYVEKGDKLILTKPIGNQAIMAAYRLQKNNSALIGSYSKSEIDESIELAIELMITPLRDVVEVVHSYPDVNFVHSMTDVSGFGLSGHLKEMLQNSKLSANIEKVPIIKLTKELAYDFGYKFDECEMPETAGGMLISVDQEQAEEFSERLSKFGVSNWIIGSIDRKHKAKYVHISGDIEHIEISKF